MPSVERAAPELTKSLEVNMAASIAESVAQLQHDATVAGVPLPQDIDWNSPEAIRIEQTIAFTYGRKFKDRGPPAPSEGGPSVWRHQAWREQSGRWGNRGGRKREFYDAKYQSGTGGSSSSKGDKDGGKK
jgi:hypothetical protein